MRVLVLTPRLFNYRHGGGGERYATEFARALGELRGFEVHVFTGERSRCLQYWPPGAAAPEPANLRLLHSLMARTDVVHLHQLNSVLGDLSIMGSLGVPRPLVLTDHGGGWVTLGRVLGRLRHRRVDGLAAVSLASAADLRWRASRPLHVLYGGGDHLGDSGRRSAEFDVIFVGRLAPHKGALDLIQALPAGATCLVLGAPVDPAYTQHVTHAARRRGVLVQMDSTDRDIVAGLRSSRWCVCPTRARVNGRAIRRPELLGLTAIEAYFQGTSVLLPSLPAFDELAPLIGATVYCSGSRASLSGALADCLAGRPCTAPTKPREFFTWRAVVRRATRCYTELTRLSRPPDED